MALVTQFLTQIRGFVVSLDGDNLAAYLQVEPNPNAPSYFQLRDELKSGFSGAKALEKLVENAMPEVDDPPEGKGSPWPSFIAFMKEYLIYWKDANFDDLADLQEMLSVLLTYVASPSLFPGCAPFLTQVQVMCNCALASSIRISHVQDQHFAV